MAQGESTKPTPVDKGKGKQSEPIQNGVDGTNGTEESQKDKDGKIIKEGKDGNKPGEGVFCCLCLRPPFGIAIRPEFLCSRLDGR